MVWMICKKIILTFLIISISINVSRLSFFFSLFLISLNVVISHTIWYSKIVINVLTESQTIHNHWKNDHDLKCVWFIVKWFLFLLVCLTLKIVIVFIGLDLAFINIISGVEGDLNGQLDTLKKWGYLWLFIYIAINVVLLIANLHIIWYRNTVVREKVLATCLYCLRFSAVTGTVVVGGYVAASYTPIVEPTPLGNWFQSKFGRGFGFSTQTGHMRHTGLMAKAEYRNVLPSILKNNPVLTDSMIDEAVQTPAVANSLTYAQSQVWKV